MREKPHLIKRIAAERLLVLPHRSFARLEAEGVIVPTKRGRGSVASLYDVSVIVPAYIAHLKAQSARQKEQDARARREQSQAELNELRLAERRGELVDAAGVERSWATHILECRNTLLGVPTHLKSRAPHLTREDIAACDTLIREALESLSADPAEPTDD